MLIRNMNLSMKTYTFDNSTQIIFRNLIVLSKQVSSARGPRWFKAIFAHPILKSKLEFIVA